MNRVNKLILILVLLTSSGLVWAEGAPPAQPAAPVGLATTAEAQNLELVAHIGGSTDAVSVQGSHAYVGVGPRLDVLDISDPTDPTRLGYIVLPGLVSKVQVAGDYAYIAIDNHGLSIVDITDPVAPVQVGFHDTGCGDFSLAGGYAYMFGENLLVVDVSDPTAPIKVGYYDPPYDINGVAVAGDNAYVAWGLCRMQEPCTGGLGVMDVSDPAAPAEIVLYKVPWGDYGGWATGVAVAGNYAYVVARDAGVRIVDISDPTTPVEVSSYDSEWAWGVTVMGNYAYVTATDETVSPLSQALHIVDVSNPDIPTRVGVYDTGGDVTVAGSRIYIAADSAGLRIVDVSNPAAPAELGAYAHDMPTVVGDIAVTGDHAYLISHQRSEMWVLDIAHPAVPDKLGFLDLSASWSAYRWSITMSDSHAYIAAQQNGLRIIDVANPAAPVEVGSYNTPARILNVAVAGDHAYVANYDGGLRIVDVGDPAAPVEVGYYTMLLSKAWNVAVADGYAYVIADGGLYVVEVSNPLAPVEVGFYDTPGTAWGVAVAGDYAYVADWDEGLRVIDVSNPAAPTEVGDYETPGYVQNVTVADGYAYVTWGYCDGLEACTGGLRIVDVSNPAAPVEISSYDTLSHARDVALANDYAYVAWGTCPSLDPCVGSGLKVLDISDPAAPTEVGAYETTLSVFESQPSVRSVALAGNYAYVGTEWDLRVVDISNPTAPTEVNDIPGPDSKGVQVVGGYVYVANDLGLQVLDISTPTIPVEAGRHAFCDAGADVAVVGGYAYVAGEDAGLRVVDVSDPAAPNQVSYVKHLYVTDVAVVGDYVYAVWGYDSSICDGGLGIVDVSDPTAPVEVGYYPAPDNAPYLRMVGDHNYAYVAANDKGLQIIDVSDPTAPAKIGSYAVPEDVEDIAVANGYAYVATAENVQVLNISDPTEPIQVGSYSCIKNSRHASVTVADGHVLATGSGGLCILQPSSSITGQVADVNGRPFPGVTIAASSGGSAVTDANGLYTLNVFTGTHTLTPTLIGYTFQPPTRTVTLPPVTSEQNFVILAGPVSTTLTPGSASLTTSLIYTDTQGLVTRLDFAGNAVAQPTRLVLTPTLVSGGAGSTFAGHAFELGAYQQGSLQFNFNFDAPVMVTLYYSQQDVQVVSDESQLALWRWTVAGWEDAANTCAPPGSGSLDLSDLDLVGRVFNTSLCRPGLFGLFGPTRQAYLPLVLHNDQ